MDHGAHLSSLRPPRFSPRPRPSHRSAILPSCAWSPRTLRLRSRSPSALAAVLSGLDQRLVPGLELARLLLRFQALSDVVDHTQPGRPAVERQIEGDNFDVDLLPVLLAVPRHPLHVGTARILKILEQLRDVLRRAEPFPRQPQQTLSRKSLNVHAPLGYRARTRSP